VVPCIEKNRERDLFNGESALRSKVIWYTLYTQNYQQPKERQTMQEREREREIELGG